MRTELKLIFASLAYLTAFVNVVIKMFTGKNDTVLENHTTKYLTLVSGIIFYIAFYSAWNHTALQHAAFLVLFFGGLVASYFNYFITLKSESIMQLLALVITMPTNSQKFMNGFTNLYLLLKGIGMQKYQVLKK